MADERPAMPKAITRKSEDFDRWYTDTVRRAELADYAPVRAAWSSALRVRTLGAIQRALDDMLKRTGHENMYFRSSSRVVSAQGGRARRGLRSRGGLGDPGRAEGARGAAGDPADLGDDHLLDVRGLDPQLPRPPRAHQPVGQRDALGEAHSALPADLRVPLAGGAHLPRDPRAGGRRGRHRARVLPRAGRGVARHPGDPGPQDRVGEVRRRRVHPLDRGDDE